MTAQIDLDGKRFGLWVVLRRGALRSPPNNAYWLCRCDCGNEREVSGIRLRNGKSRSCGCALSEAISAAKKRHGHAMGGLLSPTYRTWSGMLNRCNNPSAGRYKRYGGRGITVCQRWHSFENFLTDMGERPPGQTIERRDNNGNYEPGNCRWATRQEQSENTSKNVYLAINGEMLCVSAWAHRHSMPTERLRWRLKRDWPIEQLFLPQVRYRQNLVRVVEVKAEAAA